MSEKSSADDGLGCECPEGRFHSRPFELVIIGAGPRAICLVERLGANAPEFLTHRTLVVHLVDPFTPGSGRIWRRDQSPLLRMNSRPDQITLFPGEKVTMAGPPGKGPSLGEWADLVRSGDVLVDLEPELRAELTALNADSFVTRRLQGAYLEWLYRNILAGLPAKVSIQEHRTKATKLTPGCPQQVWLADSTVALQADAVVFSVGHGDGIPAHHASLAQRAVRKGLSYYPPGYTADTDYSAIPAGEKTLLRGMGLAFIDLVSLLTEGRDGRFEEQPDGTLRYFPSGGEPILVAGSRRGVPYQAKIPYSSVGKIAFAPKFFNNEVIETLTRQRKPLSFFDDVWPCMAKEIAWGHYTELFTGHPDRVRGDFSKFSEGFAARPWGSEEMAQWIARLVPAEEDRLDLEALNNPLAGAFFDTETAIDCYIADYLRKSLARRTDPYFSPDLGVTTAMASVLNHLPRLLSSGCLDEVSQLSHMDGWWHNFFSYVSSGPPPRRLKELVALQEAGVLTFLGSGLRVKIEGKYFVATSVNSSKKTRAKVLIEARLPEPCLQSATDPLLKSLFGAGEICEEIATSSELNGLSSGRLRVRHDDSRVMNSAGMAHPTWFALGPDTSDRLPLSFTKPGTDAPCFRQNDLVAREILTLAAKSESFHSCSTSEDVVLGS